MNLYRLVLLIPVIHVLANVTTNYFPPGTINPGFFRFVFMVIVLILYFTKYKPPQKNLFILISVFLMYNLLLVLLNENLLQPIITYMGFSIPILLFFVGYSVINDKVKLEMLFKFCLIAFSFYVLSYFIANTLGFGGSTYLDDSFYIGGSGVGAANEVAIFLLISLGFLMINNNKSWNVFSILLIACGLIIILLSMRRGAFLTLGISLLVYFYMYRNRFNSKSLKLLVASFAILLITFPYYGNQLIERYQYRTESRGGALLNYQAEARYLELHYVPISLSRENRWLTGTHNLNSATYFGRRELHVGYMAILHGSGLIGLFLFASIIFVFLKKGKLIYTKLVLANDGKTKNELYALCALYFSLISGLLIYLLSSRLHGFGLTVPCFLVMGSIFRHFHNLKFDYSDL